MDKKKLGWCIVLPGVVISAAILLLRDKISVCNSHNFYPPCAALPLRGGVCLPLKQTQPYFRQKKEFQCAIDNPLNLLYHVTVLYNTVTWKVEIMSEAEQTTLHLILSAAMQEFLEKGFKSASLRNIVKTAGVTTGAFYGYYESKEDLFEALVGEHYNYLLNCFCRAQEEFAKIPPEEQPDNLTSTSGECMYEMLLYAYAHLNEFKLILCCSEGTRFSKLIDEMVEIETKGTHDYLAVLAKLGRPAPPIDERLEHILITGMFNTFFELIIHEMPIEEAKHYLKEMRAFYTAGWMKIMGQ